MGSIKPDIVNESLEEAEYVSSFILTIKHRMSSGLVFIGKRCSVKYWVKVIESATNKLIVEVPTEVD